MFDVGGGELVLILLVILLLFGPKKLPELARSVGKGIRTMRRAQEDLTQQIRDISSDVSAPVTEVRDDIKKNITVSLDPRATGRQGDEATKPQGEKGKGGKGDKAKGGQGEEGEQSPTSPDERPTKNDQQENDDSGKD